MNRKATQHQLALLILAFVGWYGSALGGPLAPMDVQPASMDGVWEAVIEVPQAQIASEIWIKPTVFRLVKLNRDTFDTSVLQAARANAAATPAHPLVMTLPMPDGSFARFRVVESPIMAPELAAEFPEIRTFAGQGVDDPSATVRFDWTPQGFHAQVLSPNGAAYIDPYQKGNTSLYATYYKRDYRVAAKPFSCLLDSEHGKAPQAAAAAAAGPSGDTLRTYRLACAATGEYTQFHGGTVSAGMAAIVTAINRVNQIYEVEVAARMVLVANNSVIVYTNGATDPYSNNSGFSMLSQNQSNLDAKIGVANYDIGHVFSTGGGGVASLSVVCSSSGKARGVTGLPNPIGDVFWVDFVAHEIGHQFGGHHSFNGITANCCCGNRWGATAYEPGSGSTVMAYAGICGADNLQNNSDPYFHSISYDEIRSFIAMGFGNSCAALTTTGNDAPVIDAGSNHAIPASTPFELTPASSSDPNGDPLTYCWEERDLGPGELLSAPDNGSIPLFRSFNATSSASRTFPRLSTLLAGTTSNSEKLPTTNRTMRFRVTARDNRVGGGGVDWDETLLMVDAGSGPFQLIQPDGNTSVGENVTVTWDVANTDIPPVGVDQVNILLSADDGLTYPFVLASGTANDGNESVSLPTSTSTGRIKVEAVGNVFFAISPELVIMAGACQFSAAPQPALIQARNRYLSFSAGLAGLSQAIRVTFVDLPVPFNMYNGQTTWVAQPRDVSERPGVTDSTPPTSKFATLACSPVFMDWGNVGLVHVYHAGIVPGGIYDIQVIESNCSTADENNFSPPLKLTQSVWGDVAGSFDSDTRMWTAPDGSVDIVTDALALLDGFLGQFSSPGKARIDLEPDTPDQLINIIDLLLGVDAFRGRLYPFSPGPPPCP